ncbi:MAG: alpha-1,2-fucosyltransferase [Patescibacteria group bacterium]
MIITKLIGGLGNQMFQYAVARHLALKNNVELKLDKTGFETYKLHAYGLHHLNIEEVFATQKEVAAFRIYKKREGKMWFLYNRLIADPTRYVSERSFNFDPSILKLSAPVYLDGFWQSERYFKGIESIIRDEFTIKELLVGKNRKMTDAISNSTAVSMHIRRADYVTNPTVNAWHGTCDSEYYARAVSTIVQTIADPHFFIFSDDMEWARQNIILDHPVTYVDHNDARTNYEDLRLMSRCKHNIIANSSFSWWGGWLNNNPGKIVISPKNWFKTPKMDVRDLVPDTWVKL